MAVFIDDITVDVAVKEEHSFDNEVTEHPVESGSDVADNARAKPILITIEGIVSDFPLTAAASELSGGFSEQARARLEEIRNNREPITVVDSLGTYPNMVLESLSIPKDSTTGDALRFTAKFKQIIIITNERTTVPVAIPRAQAVSKRGNKPSTSPPTNNPSSGTDSWAGQLLESGGVNLNSLGSKTIDTSTVPNPIGF